MGFPGGSVVKNPPANVGDTGSVPGSGRSPGGGHSNPLQYSCLENPMDRGAWWATVHEVTESQTQMSDWAQAQACFSQLMKFHLSEYSFPHFSYILKSIWNYKNCIPNTWPPINCAVSPVWWNVWNEFWHIPNVDSKWSIPMWIIGAWRWPACPEWTDSSAAYKCKQDRG